FVVMNKEVWDDLPLETQTIIESMSEKYSVKLSRLWDAKDRKTIDTWTGKNHISIFLEKGEEKLWEQAVLPLYQSFVEEKSARGLPASEALDYCREWVRINVSLPADQSQKTSLGHESSGITKLR
ncbi:MAG: hypothetical protein P8Z37_11395, partial [Acidobacteriota bacterium]